MSEQADDQTTEITKANPELEMSLLRQRADSMGLSYHPSIKIETLRRKVQDKMDGKTAAPVEEVEEVVFAPKAETQQQIRDRVRKEALRLVRCKIYNLNPEKRDLRGEIITVANKYIGSVSKMIPFGEETDNGYHIPWVLYENLKSRKFQSVSTKKTKEGTLEVIRRLVPEYNVEILDPLTAEELQEMALRQAATARLTA